MTEHPSTRPDDARPHDGAPRDDTAGSRRTSVPGHPRPARLTDEEASGELAARPAASTSARYDTHRGISRTTQVRLAVAAVTVAVLTIAWVTLGPSATSVRGKVFGYSVQGPEAVDITFDVAKPKDASVRCTVEALNENYAQVGTKDVTVGPADVGEARYTTTIATTELAVTAIVDECLLLD